MSSIILSGKKDIHPSTEKKDINSPTEKKDIRFLFKTKNIKSIISYVKNTPDFYPQLYNECYSIYTNRKLLDLISVVFTKYQSPSDIDKFLKLFEGLTFYFIPYKSLFYYKFCSIEDYDNDKTCPTMTTFSSSVSHMHKLQFQHRYPCYFYACIKAKCLTNAKLFYKHKLCDFNEKALFIYPEHCLASNWTFEDIRTYYYFLTNYIKYPILKNISLAEFMHKPEPVLNFIEWYNSVEPFKLDEICVALNKQMVKFINANMTDSPNIKQINTDAIINLLSMLVTWRDQLIQEITTILSQLDYFSKHKLFDIHLVKKIITYLC